MSVLLDTQVFLPAPFFWNRTANWQKKKREMAQNKLQHWWNQSNTSTHLLTTHSKLLLIVLCVTWTSSLIWVQSVPGFPGSLAQGCLSNTASLCWTAAHWTSQGPHVHKGMFGWIRYIATHTPLVCLFDSTNVIWHLNWVREVPVVHWAQPVDGDPSRELFDYSGPEEAAETVRNSKPKWWFQQFLQTKASYFISFL